MRLALPFLALCCAWAGSAAAQRAGTYQVTGAGPDGAPYEGTVTLQSTGSQTWRVVWRIGGETSFGVGVSERGVFAVGYVLGRDVGTALYNVQPGGSLDGIWTAGTAGGLGRERLVPR